MVLLCLVCLFCYGIPRPVLLPYGPPLPLYRVLSYPLLPAVAPCAVSSLVCRALLRIDWSSSVVFSVRVLPLLLLLSLLLLASTAVASTPVDFGTTRRARNATRRSTPRDP